MSTKRKRTRWSPAAVRALTDVYAQTSTPPRATVTMLATALGVTERNVTVWFQNRRQRSSGAAMAAAVLCEAASRACPAMSEDELVDLVALPLLRRADRWILVRGALRALRLDEARRYQERLGVDADTAVLLAQRTIA